MLEFVLIACGGATGALLRYLAEAWGQRLVPGAFPSGTLLVNVVGCLIVGYAGAFLLGATPPREGLRLALVVGFLGGFTTFSAFAWQTLALMQQGAYLIACANLLASNALGLLAVWLGYRAAQL